MGRRKIEMETVNDSSARQVTFLKRRAGVFKKAHELATLCAAQIVIVVFSPGGKPFSYGNPSVEAVTNRFRNDQEKKPNRAYDFRSEVRLEKQNQQLSDLQKKKFEKLKEKLLQLAMLVNGIPYPKSLDDMSFDELVKMKNAMELLRDKIKARVLEIEASSSSSLLLLSKKHVQEKDHD